MSKSKGDYRERKARDEAYEKGATLVVRSAGSHGPFDLVAFYPDRVTLIQVKSSKYELSKAMKLTLSNLDIPDHIGMELWLYRLRKPFLVEVIRE